MKIFLPDNYSYVLLVTLVLNVQNMMIGFVMGGGGRKDSFSRDDFMGRNWAEEHKKACGESTEVSKQGYPDTGNGRYSKKLSYRAWFTYNSK